MSSSKPSSDTRPSKKPSAKKARPSPHRDDLSQEGADEITAADADADDDADDGAAEGNVMRAKRDLIKLGLQQGFLTSEQIQAALPLSYMSDSELQTLYFTFATMGIQTPTHPIK
jgi:hypothetical protein